MLTRYADGELLSDLVSEYGFNSTQDVWQRLRTQQLSGTYVAKLDFCHLNANDSLENSQNLGM